jgi:hypothetical protein
MKSTHVTTNGTTDIPVTDDAGGALWSGPNSGAFFAVAIRGSTLGGAAVSIQYLADDGAYYNLEGYTGLALGACKAFTWPSPVRVHVAGATSPDFYVDVGGGQH